MKSFSKFIVVGINTVTAFCVYASAAAAEDGWLIKQRRMQEPLEVIVTKNAIKASLPVRNWIAVAQAPDWTVRTFNPKFKIYFDIDYKQWVELAVIDRFTDALDVYENANKLKVLSSVVDGRGITARRRVIFESPGHTVGGRAWHGISEIDRKIDAEKKEPVKNYLCLYAPGIGSEQAARILCSLCITPPSPTAPIGMPLRYAANLKNGQTLVRLATYSVEPCKIDSKTFYIPKGYAKAEAPRQVSCPMDQSGVTEMLKQFDLGRPLGVQKQSSGR